ncbi:hypothetical protein [Microbacterium sp. B35-04]|uniref:hypothetical protein n=1 Tax=Microbacterium sp. B35-04 TaxID=1961716 RepID=UPI0031F31C4E
MDIPLIAGTVSTVVFAVSNLPMLRKALRTGDVSSYSLASIAMINVANVVYSLYVFSLPLGPIWALHTFYLVSCAIMLVLCLAKSRAARRSEVPRRVSVISITEGLEPVTRGRGAGRSPAARVSWDGRRRGRAAP